MKDGEPDPVAEISNDELPMQVIDSAEMGQDVNGRGGVRRKPIFPRFFLLLLIPLMLFTGAVIGIYIQPPALRAFLRLTGLKPGGGTSSPIAVPVEDLSAKPATQSTIRSVVALGRLAPDGKVITISPPYGAGDARIDEILVAIGSRVERGETLAFLDNRDSLQSALEVAEANVALQRSALEQTRMAIGASLSEAQAGLERARAGAELKLKELERLQTLREQRAVAQADLDAGLAAYEQAQKDVAKAEATLTRFDSQQLADQPDIALAARKLDSAQVELTRARHDLARGLVTAPVSGTILDIHARPGEKPGLAGILDIGNVQRMTAELEVYQSEISYVAVGQRVELSADALPKSLYGVVGEIGFAVERQTIIRDDPAANTDARIIKVTVYLDEESSKRASRLTNLEVTGRIAVEDPL